MNKDLHKLLDEYHAKVVLHLDSSFLQDDATWSKVEDVCRCITNKAPIRFLMSCLLAKIDKPKIDIRKPYTEIGDKNAYSGRAYDEQFIESFVIKYKLPCNPTTAFLTPAFRNIDRVLTQDLVLVGKPRKIYDYALELLSLVHKGKVAAEVLLKEILRFLLIIKSENERRMKELLKGLKRSDDVLPLSSEQIVKLISQHLACKNSSRLPVLIVAAAYLSVKEHIGEMPLPLQSHTAADKQTGSIGDVEIALINDERLVTCYEMKDKKVTKNDIDHALEKISSSGKRIDNYIFVTTEPIEDEIHEYTETIYDTTGIEVAVLNCLGFLRHFLHFFHRQRANFLDIYQELVLSQSDSAVSQPLKEAFLALRQAAESDE